MDALVVVQDHLEKIKVPYRPYGNTAQQKQWVENNIVTDDEFGPFRELMLQPRASRITAGLWPLDVRMDFDWDKGAGTSKNLGRDGRKWYQFAKCEVAAVNKYRKQMIQDVPAAATLRLAFKTTLTKYTVVRQVIVPGEARFKSTNNYHYPDGIETPADTEPIIPYIDIDSLLKERKRRKFLADKSKEITAYQKTAQALSTLKSTPKSGQIDAHMNLIIDQTIRVRV